MATKSALFRQRRKVRELAPPNRSECGGGKMAQTLDPAFQEMLQRRFIATLGTTNADGSIHLTAVWYLFEEGRLYVATSSKSRKARNVAAQPKASLMVDVRRSGAERGVTGAGRA